MRRALLLLAGLAGCSSAPLQSDWERAHLGEVVEEEQVAMPRYPGDAELVPFEVSRAPGFRFFVDAASVAVGKDGVVRYALVARSPQGSDNVTFEGMRCATREYRIYAFGHADRTWAGAPGGWLSLRGSDVAPARRVLQRQFLCPDGQPVADRAQAVTALRNPRRSADTGD